MIACASCGHSNPDGVVFCGDCGTKIEVFEDMDQSAELNLIGQTL